MKKTSPLENDMRAEYDFASMRGGVRGKYVERLRQASNIVVLEPEIAQAFPTGEAVNAALRGMLDTARAVRTHGGLPNTYEDSPGQETKISSTLKRLTHSKSATKKHGRRSRSPS
jgi:hypothetical protein